MCADRLMIMRWFVDVVVCRIVRVDCITRYLMLIFFFSSRRRHTRSDRDWSSDVCSSDLHLLRGGALPLRDGGGGAVRGFRRHLFLAAEVDRQDVRRDARQDPLLADARLPQHDLLRAAFPRPRRHAAAHPGLSADVRDLEQDLVARRVRHGPGAAAVPLYRGEVHPQRGACAAEALGRRRLARVDAPADAGAVPQLRNPAGTALTRNLKTALVLASIALMFFLGIIARDWFSNR